MQKYVYYSLSSFCNINIFKSLHKPIMIHSVECRLPVDKQKEESLLCILFRCYIVLSNPFIKQFKHTRGCSFSLLKPKLFFSCNFIRICQSRQLFLRQTLEVYFNYISYLDRSKRLQLRNLSRRFVQHDQSCTIQNVREFSCVYYVFQYTGYSLQQLFVFDITKGTWDRSPPHGLICLYILYNILNFILINFKLCYCLAGIRQKSVTIFKMLLKILTNNLIDF